MRDAQSKLDQVIAFTGQTIGAGRCRDGARAGRPRSAARRACRPWPTRMRRRRSRSPAAPSRWATTCGWSAASCRAWCAICWCCRSIRRASTIRRSPARASATGCSRWSSRFSREDLLRAFDLLTRAESDIRGAAQPRYHLEMALLRWIHLRKLTPIEDLIAGAGSARTNSSAAASACGSRERARLRHPAPLGRQRRHRLRSAPARSRSPHERRRRPRRRQPPAVPSGRRRRPPSPAVPTASADSRARRSPGERRISRTPCSRRSARRRRCSTTPSSRRRRRSRSAAIG